MNDNKNGKIHKQAEKVIQEMEKNEDTTARVKIVDEDENTIAEMITHLDMVEDPLEKRQKANQKAKPHPKEISRTVKVPAKKAS